MRVMCVKRQKMYEVSCQLLLVKWWKLVVVMMVMVIMTRERVTARGRAAQVKYICHSHCPDGKCELGPWTGLTRRPRRGQACLAWLALRYGVRVRYVPRPCEKQKKKGTLRPCTAGPLSSAIRTVPGCKYLTRYVPSWDGVGVCRRSLSHRVIGVGPWNRNRNQDGTRKIAAAAKQAKPQLCPGR